MRTLADPFELDISVEPKVYPLIRALRGDNFTWVNGSLVFTNELDPDVVESSAGLKRLQADRDKLVSNLLRAAATYQKIAALAADYKKYGHRRQLVFNLGRYSENTLISGSLTARALVFNYDQQSGTSLVRDVSSNTYGFSATVREAKWWGVQPGYILSGLPVRSYDLSSADTSDESAAQMVNQVLQLQSGRFQSTAAFVNFYWCPQDLRQSVYLRRCKGNQDSRRRLVPSLTIGVPLSSQLGEGHVFLGAGLPYVPYLNIVVGAHVGSTSYVSESVLQAGTSYTDIDRVAYDRVAIAPFIAVNASAEILGELFPKLKPAQ